MMKPASILTYLEWTRLIDRTWIKLDGSRVVWYEPDQTDYTDVLFDLMRTAPDVGASPTDFVLAIFKPISRTKLRTGSFQIGERLSLSGVESFHSFTENALAVHEHQTRGRSVVIDLSSASFAAAWQNWSTVVTGIAADFRGKALLSKLHLEIPDGLYLDDAMGRLTSLVVHDQIAKSQDTMFFGWAYVLNAIKHIDRSVVPSREFDEEMKALREDLKTDAPFLSRASKLHNYFRDLCLTAPPGLSALFGYARVDSADLLTIATLKHYERYNIKTEGKAFNYQSFRHDVQDLASLREEAAAFLVYKMGAHLSDRVVASLPTSPQSTSAPLGADEGMGRSEVSANAAANPVVEVTPDLVDTMQVESSPTAAGGDAELPVIPSHQAAEQENTCPPAMPGSATPLQSLEVQPAGELKKPKPRRGTSINGKSKGGRDAVAQIGKSGSNAKTPPQAPTPPQPDLLTSAPLTKGEDNPNT